ncbi:ankyrin repeat protein [Sporothrix brasiliensis 5110]|uniref:Ankyrin repeat protein n=1 Tax=Sporothrix brasiliensis 5110 TaxID=1398154 RepID=A0A0C2IZF7_9PEZI|nr:ankyrin repeat protein [Sporothrix brasiliensis 5110]KIH90357.1 ankyrin repeat protein [Sporothrix brasiliensis 5110]
MMPFLQLPPIPAPHAELPSYLEQHPDKPMTELFEPYRKYEARVRELYAQEPGHPVLVDPHVNVLPLFTEDTPKLQIRARDTNAEPEDLKAKYIMSLPKENRRANGSPAVVPSIEAFQGNFAVFSESSLADIGWENVVAAGSSVVNCLLPVPDEFSKSRRSLREYYHEKFCPASDVDLFLYGLTEEQAIEKIKEIEAGIRDSILAETTTVRTKHAITICSEYPTRHVQIVLRIYKSVSEILAGFDIDSSSAAYDGKQVYCTPRALQSYMTQINHIDLTRRSPSYENRLSKYSHRNFEVFWGDLDRSRVDPTIFERSFNRTLGLARLLVLERLPTADSRQSYATKRRQERGRPPLYNSHYLHGKLGNIKDQHEDEVAEWVTPDDVNNYDTFVLPYGRKYHAKRIEKLCYTRDLLLNAEWNQKKDREVYLHRHPAFFGRAEDVMEDCCCFCPKPQTDREKEVAEEESKTYISGKISFVTDDPGRQQIGSFNPLTDNDWTEMAYVGNTARLCQAIIDGDLEHVEDWLAQDGVDPNRRDHTGRTPLHLAVMTSSPAIVKKLVDHGARLISRVADGRTALHLAAQRGSIEIVKILMDKSTENEAEEDEKQNQRRKAKLAADAEKKMKKGEESEGEHTDSEEEEDVDDDNSDGELIDDEVSDDGVHSVTTASFVKVKSKDKQDLGGDAALNDADDEPDFYDVNVIAWDRPCSALHFAIINGHDEVVKLLCQEYGADVLLPVKLLNSYNQQPSSAILTLALGLALPVDKAKSMTATLLRLGATCAQADLNGITAFHRFVEHTDMDLVQQLMDLDKTGAPVAMNSLSFQSAWYSASPLLCAIASGNVRMALKLLENGVPPQIDFDTWLKYAKASTAFGNNLSSFEENNKTFNMRFEQPLIVALRSSNPKIALELLERGADPDTKTKDGHAKDHQRWMSRLSTVDNALALVRGSLKALRGYKNETPKQSTLLEVSGNPEKFLATLSKDSWMYVAALCDLKKAMKDVVNIIKKHDDALAKVHQLDGEEKKKAAIKDMIATLEKIEAKILETTRQPRVYENKVPPVESTKDYNYAFVPEFFGVNDVTYSRRCGYVQLFEAAWNGDLATIKQLTLGSWGENKSQKPLTITVNDAQSNNAFSLAFLRGHYKVATAILEITQAQYSSDVKQRVSYEMKEETDDEDTSMNSDSEYEEDETGTYRIIVDNDQFTIDNIGEVNMQVKGTVTPLDLLAKSVATFTVRDGKVTDYKISSGSLFEFVFQQNDRRGFEFLLDTATHFATQTKEGNSRSSYYNFPISDFRAAVTSGRVEMLAEVIKRTGAGLPLEEMVKDSGIKIEEPPEYYQGLTVYGKKRSDWAEAGRKTVTRSTGMTDSPLLFAAEAGCLESIEWFLSDAPLRCYLEFTASKAARDDKRLTHLSQAPGGFEGAISRWLTKNTVILTWSQGDLALNKAMACPDAQKALPVIKYLLKVAPDSISAGGEDRMTPLLSAVRFGHLEAVKILVDSGADQSKRHETTYANLLHVALFESPKAPELKRLLDILGKDAVDGMFCERTHHASWSESRTPLHAWLERTLSSGYNVQYGPANDYGSDEEVIAVMRLLLSRSGGRELNIIDSAGDTVMHMLARKQKNPNFMLALLEAIPRELAISLLYRENAVGATPLEVAQDVFLASFVTERRENTRMFDLTVNKWPSAKAEEFTAVVYEGREQAPIPTRITTNKPEALKRAEETLTAVNRFLRGEKGKRRLVSLHEANDVARRVGHGYQNQRYPVKLVQPASDTEEGKSGLSGQNGGRTEKVDPMRLAFHPYSALTCHTTWRTPNKDKEEGRIDAEVDALIAKFLL